MKKLRLVIGLVLVSLIPVGGFVYWQVDQYMSSTILEGTGAKEVFLEIRKNDSPQKIIKDLADIEVVTSPTLFYWIVRFTQASQSFKAGDYRFTNKMTLSDVIKTIQSGISYTVPITIPEGYNIFQIAEVLDRHREGLGQDFLKKVRDSNTIRELGFKPSIESLEGYLFPDTYGVSRMMTGMDLIHQMVKRFRSVVTSDLEDKAKDLGFSIHQVITLASIIEKETGAIDERPVISSVFHNRLKRGMKLQSDPTVIYAVPGYNGNITRKHLETWTPFNTYRIPGLPKGPIANPGKQAILAALYPDKTPYLYFVSHNDGTHEFTQTFEQHTRAVGKYQLNPRAREGKSWRDLSKKR